MSKGWDVATVLKQKTVIVNCMILFLIAMASNLIDIDSVLHELQ